MNQELSRRAALGLGAAAGIGLFLGARSQGQQQATGRRRAIVWSEGTAPQNVYPNDIRAAVAEGLKPLAGWEIVTATITDPDQGASQDDLNKTDVLLWWGHKLHGQVKREVIDRIEKRVKEGGMGFISLHSSHLARPYVRLMKTRCTWSHYVADASRCKLIVKAPDHPIARGLKDFEMPQTERYGEPFQCPPPETVVFDGLYTLPNGKSEPSRQILTWTIGKGRVVYCQPGHETYPIFFQDEIRQLLRNAVEWAAPTQVVS